MSESAGAMALRPLGGPAGAGANQRSDQLREVAQEFEAIFLAQMLASLTSDLEGGGPLGGQEGDPFRQMLTDEIAKVISRAGGIGVGDAVLKEMLKLQEVA